MARYRDIAKERRWLDLVRRWRQSNLTVGDFCERHGLAEPNFYCWRRVLCQRGLIGEDGSPVEATVSTPTFVKLEVEPGAVAGATAAIELVLPRGRLLRVRPGFDRELLRQLVALLEEPSC